MTRPYSCKAGCSRPDTPYALIFLSPISRIRWCRYLGTLLQAARKSSWNPADRNVSSSSAVELIAPKASNDPCLNMWPSCARANSDAQDVNPAGKSGMGTIEPSAPSTCDTKVTLGPLWNTMAVCRRILLELGSAVKDESAPGVNT